MGHGRDAIEIVSADSIAAGAARHAQDRRPARYSDTPALDPESVPGCAEPAMLAQPRAIRLDREHLRKHRIVAFDKNDASTGVFDVLRTKVLRLMEARGWRSLAITSPIPGAGKTVVSINLAISIAQRAEKSVLLVDFDFRRPKVAPILGIPAGISLNELVEGKAKTAEALVSPELPRLLVLPTNSPVPNSSEVLCSQRITQLVEDLHECYADHLLVFDLPPLLNVDDAFGILPQIDCVLLVVGDGMSSRAEIEDCARLIPEAKLLGVVLNKADVPITAYY